MSSQLGIYTNLARFPISTEIGIFLEPEQLACFSLELIFITEVVPDLFVCGCCSAVPVCAAVLYPCVLQYRTRGIVPVCAAVLYPWVMQYCTRVCCGTVPVGAVPILSCYRSCLGLSLVSLDRGESVLLL
ncbi:hypothetical protein J6590_018338 [Homalodisca vitripennis]|nr:hypothetical protein J6590_018338 [Homalodisca vitripennis]